MVGALRVPQDFALLRQWTLAPWWVAGLCSDRREAPTGQSCGAPQVSHGAAAPAGRHSDSGAPHTSPPPTWRPHSGSALTTSWRSRGRTSSPLSPSPYWSSLSHSANKENRRIWSLLLVFYLHNLSLTISFQFQ